MNQNRNPLVPTPIVDKNGVITTRHKKVETSTQGSSAAIPAVSLTSKKATYEEGSVEQLCTLIYGKSDPSWLGPLNLLKGDDSETIPLFIRLLTTGESKSRSTVRRTLAENVEKIASVVKVEDPSDWSPENKSHLMKARHRELTSPFIKHDLVSRWNASEVAIEADLNLEVSYMVDDMYDLDDFINALDGGGDRSGDNDYWRGLAIIVATDIMVGQDKVADVKPLALWAAKQPNIRQIIEVAKERETLNVDVISGVIEEQNRSNAALRKGAL